MLHENIRAIRKAKGLSQEELATKLNVVRQTISKWEKGLSVPDSEMLLSISKHLETPVSALLGEAVTPAIEDDVTVLAEKLEIINLQFSQRTASRRKILHRLFLSLCTGILILFVVIYFLQSPYLGWDYSDPETAVLGVGFHSIEWLFVRLAPLVFVGGVVGAVLTRKKG